MEESSFSGTSRESEPLTSSEEFAVVFIFQNFKVGRSKIGFSV